MRAASTWVSRKRRENASLTSHCPSSEDAPCSPGGLPFPGKADASLPRASVDLGAPVKPHRIALK